jgi:hypothetical protein
MQDVFARASEEKSELGKSFMKLCVLWSGFSQIPQ